MTTAIILMISQQYEGWEVARLMPAMQILHESIPSKEDAIATAEAEATRYEVSTIMIVESDSQSRIIKRSSAPLPEVQLAYDRVAESAISFGALRAS